MRIIVHSLLALGGAALTFAQVSSASSDPSADAPVAESSGPVAGIPGPATFETHIYSDSVELGIKTRSAVYRGHVRLEDPRLFLTCEELTADVPEEGSRVERVVARTNVVVVLVDEQGRTNRAYADQTVYTYRVSESGTNELVEFTGHPNPRIERQEGTLYGDVIIWDRTRNQIRATNQRMIYRVDPATNAPPGAPADSNAPAGDKAIRHE
ncbi:MAG: LptA/OstA family protein [Verrucomicrobia bacterium]|jgi:lipopolysaccharide export system protein LptA|nr:LptA/OstA family protein [Verrucomicrobiota bacterium]